MTRSRWLYGMTVLAFIIFVFIYSGSFFATIPIFNGFLNGGLGLLYLIIFEFILIGASIVFGAIISWQEKKKGAPIRTYVACVAANMIIMAILFGTLILVSRID